MTIYVAYMSARMRITYKYISILGTTMFCTCFRATSPCQANFFLVSFDYCLCLCLVGSAICMYVFMWHWHALTLSITGLLQKSINSRIWRTFLFVSNQRRLCSLHRYIILVVFSLFFQLFMAN